jgi:OOP family OmpA-OmpF porin
MSLARAFLVFSFAAVAALPAVAQDSSSSWRWRSLQGSPSLGLTLGRAAPPVYCGSVLFPCDPSLAQGVNLSLTGKSTLAPGFGIYGRLGTTQGRGSLPGLPGASWSEADSMYGVGVSWDVTPRTTATFGWDIYDFRTAGGRDPVRFTSLGLQWRY